MENRKVTRSERFLQLYRVLEGELEKRFSGRESGSVVMDYLRNADSEPYRYQLNVCREIRNLLSHNAAADGSAVVEPSQSMLDVLEEILKYVSAPRMAVDYGTPVDKLLSAHPNDLAIDVMHRMDKMGFSHVPVMERGRLTGVFSVGSVFAYLERNGLDSLQANARIGELKDALSVEKRGAEKYLFLPENVTMLQVRAEFEKRKERNSRLSAVFITRNGSGEEPLVAMLTPWDVLKESVITE